MSVNNVEVKEATTLEIPPGLTDAIRTFPVERVVEHCGERKVVSPFDIYTTCDKCGQQIKLRAFSGGEELEDLFDAVFEWMTKPSADSVVSERKRQIEEDEDD